jgi:hypothetical protein
LPASNARAVISSKLADYHGNRALGLPWVVTVGAEVAGLQATDLIDTLVQSCTGGRTESFNHETTLNLAHELLPGHVITTGPRRAAW